MPLSYALELFFSCTSSIFFFILHLHRMFRTCRCADPALHTFFFVQFPDLFFPVHQDRLLWALLCTERTVDAFLNVNGRFSPSGSGSRRLFFLRFDKCLALFCDSRFCIPLCHAQTFLRAGGNAAAALHTVEPVDRPCSCRSVYLDRCRRTGSRAEPAADTVADLYLHMSPHPLRIFCRLKRVLHCCRLSEEIPQDSSR